MHCKEQWFLEKYHPLLAYKWKQAQIAQSAKLAERFKQEFLVN